MTTSIPDEISVKFATPDAMGVMWGDRLVILQPQANVLACRLADWSGEPDWSQEMYDKMAVDAPLEAGWRPDICVFCTQDVQMGPRQRAVWELAPQDFTVGCLMCAAVFVKWNDAMGGRGDTEIDMLNLGGK